MDESRFLIREASASDLSAIRDIYNQAILAGGHTCDTELVTYDERERWLLSHCDHRTPVFVAQLDDRVVGYAYLTAYRGRGALMGVAEVSYYVDFGFLRQGIGSMLLAYAMEKARELEYHTLLAILLESNKGSIALLRRFGFSEWGRLPKIARFNSCEYDHLYYGIKL